MPLRKRQTRKHETFLRKQRGYEQPEKTMDYHGELIYSNGIKQTACKAHTAAECHKITKKKVVGFARVMGLNHAPHWNVRHVSGARVDEKGNILADDAPDMVLTDWPAIAEAQHSDGSTRCQECGNITSLTK